MWLLRKGGSKEAAEKVLALKGRDFSPAAKANNFNGL